MSSLCTKTELSFTQRSQLRSLLGIALVIQRLHSPFELDIHPTNKVELEASRSFVVSRFMELVLNFENRIWTQRKPRSNWSHGKETDSRAPPHRR